VTLRRERLTGAATQVATEISVLFGASIAGLLIPVVGAVVIVAVRQAVMALVLLPLTRPRLRSLTWSQLWPAIALGLALATMNLSFYEAIGRLGIGITVTIEFLGPLTLALVGSRRLIDFACAVGAAVGVFLLTATAGPMDPLGVVLALVAAASWAAYIILTKRVAATTPGFQGITIASVIAVILLVPMVVITVDITVIDWRVTGLLIVIGILASAIPYSLDSFILRRITPRLYAVLTSLEPAIAAGFGWLVLGESFTLQQQAAIAIVCGAAAIAIGTQRDLPESVNSASPPLDDMRVLSS
jgi:inner membrane transporter RhtA